MRKLVLIATVLASVASATPQQAGACTLRLPTFEVTGFPISPLQVAVLGGAKVEESSATPKLMSSDMPASPSQIAILTRRPKPRIVEASADNNQLTVAIARPHAQKSAAETCD